MSFLASCKEFFTKEKKQFFIFFLIFIAIRFLPFLFGKTLVFGDNFSLMMPGKIFTAEWLKQGVLPLWNPYVFAGMPWVADINQSVLYPSTLLFLVFSPAIALNLLLISHALVAYSGMYLLAKLWFKDHWWAILAGGLWMFSTQVSGSMNNFSTLQSIVWLPLLAYFGLKLVKESKNRIWFAVVVALQFWGGYPQHVLYGIGLAVLLSAFAYFQLKKLNLMEWLKAWSLTAGLVLLLSAAAWMPFVEMLLNSTRMEQTTQQALVGSLNPVMLIKFFLPYFFDNPATGMKWGPAWNGQPNVGIYVTWLGWLAIGVTFIQSLLSKSKTWLKKLDRETILFSIFTVITLVFSLGEYLPGFNIVQQVIPFFRIARYPSMVMIMTNVVLILWTVKALKSWQITKRQYRLFSILGGVGIVAGLVSLGVWQYGFESVWKLIDQFVSSSLSTSPFHTLERDKIILFEISKNILFNSIFFLTSLYFFYQKKIRIVSTVLVLEILVNTQGMFYFAPNKIYDTVTENSQQLIQQMGLEKTKNNYRILTRNVNTPYTDYGSYWEAMVVRAPFSDSFVDEQELKEFNHVQHLRDGLTPNWNMVFGAPTVHGYTTLLPKDYAQLWQSSDSPRINFIDQLEPTNELLDQWAVQYYLVDSWFKVDEDLSTFELVGGVGKVELVGGAGEIQNEVRWQVLERSTALSRFRFEDGSNEGLVIKAENPSRIDLQITSQDDHQYLVMADRYDQDWRVFVNDQEQTIENFNGMRRVVLEQGAERISFVYCPKLFILGLIISSLTLLGLGGWLWQQQRKSVNQ